MVSRVLSLCAALILAIGIAALPVSAKTKKPAPPKKTSTSKKSTAKKVSKKDTKKSSAKSTKKGKKDKKADSRTAKKVTKPKSSSKRGKNESEEKYAPSRSRSRTVVASTSPVVRPTTVISGGGATYIETDEPDATAGPRPANRIVADIAPARVIQIQNALIKEGLMTGPANGVYDQATFSAMSSFQSRKGYKPLGVPTADSLKALGVPKNSGRTYMSASRVLESTAPKQE